MTTQARVRLTTGLGEELTDPTEAQIEELVLGIDQNRDFVLIDKYAAGEMFAHTFAQAATPLPGSTSWLVEYRDGVAHYQAETPDLATAAKVLNDYTLDRRDWRTALPWQLLMVHQD